MTNPAKDDEALVRAVARTIASTNGDDYDAVPRSKVQWVHRSGMFGGRFRDVNEPDQGDYDDMARAAIATVRAHEAESLRETSRDVMDRTATVRGHLAAAKPDGDAARDMTAAERLRMERETKAVHRAFDAVFAPRHSQWKGDK